MATESRLTSGIVRNVIRIFGIASILLLIGGTLLLWAPVNDAPPLSTVAQATSRTDIDEPLLFSKYAELLGTRSDLFEFGQINRITVALKTREVEVPVVPAEKPETPEAPATPPAPQPDIAGLQLIGTVPGTNRAFALVRDSQQSTVLTLQKGEAIRNAVIEEVFEEYIVIGLDGQTAKLELPKSDIVNSNATEQPIASPNPVISNASVSNSTLQTRAPAKPKASLGMSGYIMDSDTLEENGLSEPALLITRVKQSDSLVKPGDILLSIEDRNFESISELKTIIEAKARGDTVLMTLLRDGKRVYVKARLS